MSQTENMFCYKFCERFLFPTRQRKLPPAIRFCYFVKMKICVVSYDFANKQ